MAMNKVPTLLVGLGGIGCKIANMTYDMLSDEDRKYVGAIGIDTNVGDLKMLTIDSIRTSDGRRVEEYLKEHPEYQEWFPVSQFLADRDMVNGAGQIRCISRLAALASIESNRFSVLDDVLKQIMEADGERDNTGVNIFFMGSITGGTGAGLFLQMPFYIRNYLKQQMGIRNVRIRGLFFSADITRNLQPSKINRKAVQVNAYTCIKELNAFYMVQKNPKIADNLSLEYYEVPDRKEKADEIEKDLMTFHRRKRTRSAEGLSDRTAIRKDAEALASAGVQIPYDAFYLMEGSYNNGTIGNAKIDTLIKHASKILYTILFTPVKRESDGASDNFVLADMEGGGMARFSSAGMSILLYPYAQIKEYVTLRWIKDLVKEDWLLIDEKYEEERAIAEKNQRNDPNERVPEIENSYVQIFKNQTSGEKGTRLGHLRADAFIENEKNAAKPLKKSDVFLNRIEGHISEIIKGSTPTDNCQMNRDKAKTFEGAKEEIKRIDDQVKQLEKKIDALVAENKNKIVNEIFPTSDKAMKLNMDSELNIYSIIGKAHPVAARYLIYSMLNDVKGKLTALETSLLALKQQKLEKDNYAVAGRGKSEKAGDISAADAVGIIADSRFLKIGGKSSLRKLTDEYGDRTQMRIETLQSYGITSLSYYTYDVLKDRLEFLAKYYKDFFAGIRKNIRNNEKRVEHLEKSFQNPEYGVIPVYATPEAFREIYQEFKVGVRYALPEEVKERIFKNLFSITLGAIDDQRLEMNDTQKKKRDLANRENLSKVFEEALVSSMSTIVEDEGNRVIDLSIKEAISKSFQLESGIRERDDDAYEAMRIEYEKELIERTLRATHPMFSVENVDDPTELIYVALNPESAEESEGKPDKGMTESLLLPKTGEASDQHGISVILDDEFSKYEIVCIKTQHKVKIESLTKFRPDSEFAKLYRERISNIGAIPLESGDDAYKEVINPHLNRYWAEEAFIPSLTEKERKEKIRDHKRAFFYALGYEMIRLEETDSGLAATASQSQLKSGLLRHKTSEDQEVSRNVWRYHAEENEVYEIRMKGSRIGRKVSSVYEALRYNRVLIEDILYNADEKCKIAKEMIDLDDVEKSVLASEFVKNLIKSKYSGENIFDIILNMYDNLSPKQWDELFDSISDTIFDYLSGLLDRNQRYIDTVYPAIIDCIYSGSKIGIKESGNVTPDETEEQKLARLDLRERKVRENAMRILDKRYI